MSSNPKFPLAVYGAGGLGREIASLINRINAQDPKWEVIGFFDDGKEKENKISHFGRCLGGINELNNWKSQLDVVLAFGNPKTLDFIYHKITNPLISFPNIIDPSFVCTDLDTFTIGQGNIIQIGTYLTTNVTIGDFNLLNGSVAVGHDTKIGDFNVFMPGCKISGESTIGNRNLFGAQSFVLQQTDIGEDVTISPLSALLTKPKNNSLYIGNPARRIKL